MENQNLNIIESLLNTFEPFRNWLLIAVGILLIVAIAGGAGVALEKIRIGKLKGLSRAIAGILAILCLVVFLFVPKNPIGSPIVVYGKIIQGLYPELDMDDVHVQLVSIRKKKPLDHIIGCPKHDQLVRQIDGTFKYPKTCGLEEDKYMLSIMSNGVLLLNKEVLLSNGIDIIIDEKIGGGFFVDTGNIIEYLENKYISSSSWRDTVKAIEHLSHLACSKKEVINYFEKYLSEDFSKKKKLSIFVLGQACESIAFPHLEDMYKDDQIDTWDKLRIARCFVKCGTQQASSAKSFLLTMAIAVDKEGESEKLKTQRNISALYLLMTGSKNKYVVKRVFDASMSIDLSPSNLMLNSLKKFAWEDKNNTEKWKHEDWSKWWEKIETTLNN